MYFYLSMSPAMLLSVVYRVRFRAASAITAEEARRKSAYTCYFDVGVVTGRRSDEQDGNARR